MEKSTFSTEYGVFLRLLRQARQRAKLTQQEVAARMGTDQSFVSKCERGERRIDVVELKHFCDAFHLQLNDFIAELCRELYGDRIAR